MQITNYELWTFEMLVVLAVGPVASPDKPVLLEKAIAQIAFHNLIGEVLLAVEIAGAGGGLDDLCAIGQDLVIGVVERVDIDCHA